MNMIFNLGENVGDLRDFADLYSVLELEVNRCVNQLVVSQHCGGYDRGAQYGAQIPGFT